jgi:hypothetical protein
VPSLFGLTKEFNTKGKPITSVIERVEQLEQEHPLKNFRALKNLDDIEVSADKFSVFDVLAPKHNPMSGISEMYWVPVGHERLNLPVPVEAGKTGGDNYIIRLSRNRLGQWTAQQVRKGKEGRDTFVSEGVAYDSLHDAASMLDQYIKHHHSDVLHLMRANAPWHSDKATKPQLRLLRTLKAPIPRDLELTKANAHSLIEYYKH